MWRVMARLFPRPVERQYFKEMHDVEISLDWNTGEFHITGYKIKRATDEQAMWIKHIVRSARKNGSVNDIDKV